MKLSPFRVKQLAVLAIGIVIVLFFKYGKPAPAQVDSVAVDAPAIDVLQIKPGPIVMTVHTQGTVKPWLEIDVLSQVTGEVKEVGASFAEGGFFSKGDSLVQVDELNWRCMVGKGLNGNHCSRWRCGAVGVSISHPFQLLAFISYTLPIILHLFALLDLARRPSMAIMVLLTVISHGPWSSFGAYSTMHGFGQLG